MKTTTDWNAVIEKLGPTFAARAEACDRAGEFVSENYRELKEARVFSAGVPESLGGGGATHAELCDLLRRLAHHCPSTALALSMHTHLLATAVWRHTHGQDASALLGRVAKEQAVLVSTGANDWLESNGKAVKVEGGWRVTMTKRFASGSPAGTMAVTTCQAEDPVDGPCVIHFALPLSAAGVVVKSDWDTLGMRATGSQSIEVTEAFVPDAAVSLKRARGKWHPSYNVVCTVAVPIFMSVYVGIAERAQAIVRSAKRDSADVQTQVEAGELQNRVFSAQLLLKELVANARNYDFTPELERANAALTCKTLAVRAVRGALDKAVELSGGAAFFRRHPLERLWRDVQASQFHPLPEAKQLVFSGRLALGLTPA